MTRLLPLALALTLAGCDWPDTGTPETLAATTGPWPMLVDDATLGIGAAAPEAADDAPDLEARRAALEARAATLAAQ